MLNGDLVRTGKKLCLHSQFQGRNLNLGPPEHEVEVPISIVCYIWRWQFHDYHQWRKKGGKIYSHAYSKI